MKRRTTATTTAVLSALKQADGALSHERILAEIDGKADRATIYRILNRFCKDGLTHRVIADDGKQYFALCTSCSGPEHQHDHFHFRCLSCDIVECLTADISVQLPSGYQAINFNGVISGHCRNCN